MICMSTHPLSVASIKGDRPEVENSSGLPEPDGQALDLAPLLTPLQEAADVRDLWAALAHAVSASLNVDGCLVAVLDEERETLVDAGASVKPPYHLNLIVEEYSLNDFPETRKVIETGQALEVSVSDPGADIAERRFLSHLGVSRVLISQLRFEGKGIGAIEAYRLEDRPFRRDDPRQVDLLVSFAANVYSRLQMASRLEKHYTETMEALVSALEARDPATQAHTGRIRDLAVALAVVLQLPSDVRRSISLGAILHDVGKIGISDTILSKPGPLDEGEWTVMKSHPQLGERMLAKVDFLTHALPIVRNHHERWDGSGYPDGLQEETIPMGARIVAVCDAFDAMTSERPYSGAVSVEAACAELIRCAGSQFDPICANLLVDLIEKLGPEHLDENIEEKLVRYAS
jgi:HD-GYP domain-containing protein (c-di-GMP phosphodiesterase class II)